MGAIFHPGDRFRYGEVWWLVRRWNWALLAFFYLAVLIDAIRFRDCPGATIGHAEDLSPIEPRYSAWDLFTVGAWAGAGVACGLLVSWAYFDLTPPMIRVDRSPYGSGAYGIWGEHRVYYFFASFTLVAVAALMGFTSLHLRRRTGLWSFQAVLALLWGFATSVHLVETPHPATQSRIIYRTIKPSSPQVTPLAPAMRPN